MERLANKSMYFVVFAPVQNTIVFVSGRFTCPAFAPLYPFCFVFPHSAVRHLGKRIFKFYHSVTSSESARN